MQQLLQESLNQNGFKDLSFNLSQSQDQLQRKHQLEVASTLIDSAWGASHQSMKWSSLRNARFETQCCLGQCMDLQVQQVLEEQRNTLYIWSNEIIISETPERSL